LAQASGVASDSVFVYGLLKRGFSLHHHMAQGTFAGDATARGILYSLGEYPGMVDGDGSVLGELYRFDDVAVALELLDEVEEYDPLEPERSLYVRTVRPVTLRSSDAPVPAWCYLYNRSVKDLTRIASGAFLR
jgi:gamma-glutamylcyclotransferase (GGCT)/AIG2-like uncharacterized protein YtfP